MQYMIRELRDTTGLTQKEFAHKYGIPLSTLCKWEQGESSPPSYVITLLARALPGTDARLPKISGPDGAFYYYDKIKKTVSDRYGNSIVIQEDLDTVNRQNLILYLQDMFHDFYMIQEKFNKDCRLDKEEGIIWTR